MLKFKMRHVFQKPIKLRGTFAEMQSHSHVNWIVGLGQTRENFL